LPGPFSPQVAESNRDLNEYAPSKGAAADSQQPPHCLRPDCLSILLLPSAFGMEPLPN